jgi:hypothetical protein
MGSTGRGVAVLLAVLVLAACGGGTGEQPTRPVEETAAEDGTDAEEAIEQDGEVAPDEEPETAESEGEAGRWVSVLATVPDDASTRALVVVNDHAAAARAREIVPRDEPIVAGSSFSGALSPDDADEWRVSFGFDVGQVELDLEAGLPPERYEVLQGRFDPDAVDDAVRSDPVWADELETAEHLGVTYYRWGEDRSQDLARSSPTRPIGVGGRLALVDDVIMRAAWTEGIEQMIGARSGERPSLAEAGDLVEAARAIEHHGGFSASLTTDVLRFEAGQAIVGNLDLQGAEDQPQASEEIPALDAYRALATGVGVDEDGWFQLIALAHDDETDAAANAERLEEVLADGVSFVSGAPWQEVVDDWTITVDRAVTVAVLRTASRGLWNHIVQRPDLVIWR